MIPLSPDLRLRSKFCVAEKRFHEVASEFSHSLGHYRTVFLNSGERVETAKSSHSQKLSQLQELLNLHRVLSNSNQIHVMRILDPNHVLNLPFSIRVLDDVL